MDEVKKKLLRKYGLWKLERIIVKIKYGWSKNNYC